MSIQGTHFVIDPLRWTITQEEHLTQLIQAIEKGNLEQVIALECHKLKADLLVDMLDVAVSAISAIQLEVARYLIKKCRADVNGILVNGQSPLFSVARKGNRDMADLFVQAGGNPNTAAEGGRTPFSIAAEVGHTDVVRVFLQKGKAYVNQRDDSDAIALHYAAYQGHLETVRCLVEEGKSDLTARNRQNWTPLLSAGNRGHLLVVEYLLLKGAPPYDAIRSRYLEVVHEVQIRVLAAMSNPSKYIAEWRTIERSDGQDMVAKVEQYQLEELQRRLQRIVTGVHAEIHASLRVALSGDLPPQSHPVLATCKALPEELRLYITGQIARNAVEHMSLSWADFEWSLQGRAMLSRIPPKQLNAVKDYLRTGTFSAPTPALIDRWSTNLALL